MLRDVAAAEAYCAVHLGPPGFRQLLAMLLEAAMLPEACHLLRVAGALLYTRGGCCSSGWCDAHMSVATAQGLAAGHPAYCRRS